MVPQIQAEVDKINTLLPPHLQLNEQSSDVMLWAAIFSLHGNYVAGPAPHKTWKDAAVSERVERLRKS